MIEKTIERPGSTTTYSVIGEGPPVLLGHSLLCQRSMWDGVVEQLKGDFTFLNVGLRGHNESTATAPFTVWDLAADWVAILDQENIDRAVACGLSTGGMTAMRMAVKHPERVVGLALLDTDAGPETSLWKRFQFSALGKLYAHTGFIPVSTLAKAMFCKKTRRQRRELVDDFIALARTFDRKQLRHTMKAVFGRDAVDVSGVEVPTLVITGAEDEALPVERSRRIADAIDGAALEIVADAGHLSTVEQPDDVASLLRPFLASCWP